MILVFFLTKHEEAAAAFKGLLQSSATKGVHAQYIVTDHGWKILLGRGLDIFQHYEMNDSFPLSNRLQQYRACKAFEITYLKIDGCQ